MLITIVKFSFFYPFQPPIIPKVSFEGDTRNFDEYPEEESFRVNGISKAQLELFADF